MSNGLDLLLRQRITERWHDPHATLYRIADLLRRGFELVQIGANFANLSCIVQCVTDGAGGLSLLGEHLLAQFELFIRHHGGRRRDKYSE